MPRFMPVPKLAVAPVSEPSAPILIVAPPPPGVACSAQETVPAAAAAAGPLARRLRGLRPAAAGALVGAAAGVEVHAASTTASPLSATSCARRVKPILMDTIPPNSRKCDAPRFARHVTTPTATCLQATSGAYEFLNLGQRGHRVGARRPRAPRSPRPHSPCASRAASPSPALGRRSCRWRTRRPPRARSALDRKPGHLEHIAHPGGPSPRARRA